MLFEAGMVAFGRPARNWSLGAPGQFVLIANERTVSFHAILRYSHSESTCKLDEIPSSDVVTRQEWRESIDGVIDTRVLGERELNVLEDDHRAVCAITLQLAGLGEADGVVESQAERLMHVFAALAIKQILLKVIHQREEGTALE